MWAPAPGAVAWRALATHHRLRPCAPVLSASTKAADTGALAEIRSPGRDGSQDLRAVAEGRRKRTPAPGFWVVGAAEAEEGRDSGVQLWGTEVGGRHEQEELRIRQVEARGARRGASGKTLPARQGRRRKRQGEMGVRQIGQRVTIPVLQRRGNSVIGAGRGPASLQRRTPGEGEAPGPEEAQEGALGWSLQQEGWAEVGAPPPDFFALTERPVRRKTCGPSARLSAWTTSAAKVSEMRTLTCTRGGSGRGQRDVPPQAGAAYPPWGELIRRRVTEERAARLVVHAWVP